MEKIALRSDRPLADLNVRAGRLRQLARTYDNGKINGQYEEYKR